MRLCVELLFCLGFLVSAQGLVLPWQDVPNNDLVQYVRDARKAGLKPPEIQKNAMTVGWSR